jgi:peptidoglycan/LPS O-acetylase OafA/YrhL
MTPTTDRSKDLPNLDLLRAVAVLLVFGDHALESVGERFGSSFHPYDWYMGRLGVVLFFVHTSLVLMWSMDRLRLDGWPLLRSFYVRRIFRIYPLSALCVLGVTLFAVPARPWEAFIAPTATDLASNLLLTMNVTGSRSLLSPLWSLPIEVQMYAALPVIFMLVASSPLRTSLMLYVAAVVFAIFVSPFSNRLGVLYFAPCFISGVVCYCIAKAYAPRFSGALWLPFVAAAVIAYVALESVSTDVHSAYAQWLVALLVGIMIPFFKQSANRLLNRTAFEVAKYSYGIYLFHNVAIWFGCHRWDLAEPYRWAITLLVLALLSYGSFHLLERPAMRVGARLAERAERKRSLSYDGIAG